jgi:integrase
MDTDNLTVTRYLATKRKKTAQDYRKRLLVFRDFITQTYQLTLDELIKTMTVKGRGPKIDVYDMLLDYEVYIQKERKVSPLTLKLLVSTVRNYLETFDVEISQKKFQLKVGMPRVIRAEKEPLSKEDIQIILGACHNLKLRTYVLTLAATGMRASEALSIRICDINFDSSPATIFLRGEFTKTGADRIVMLTDELASQLKLWVDYKHRIRTVSYTDKTDNKRHYKKLKPEIDKESLLFSVKYNEKATVGGLYTNVILMFERTLERLGGKFSAFEYGKKRRKITLHSMRRFTKSTISNLGYEQFSEEFLGHSHSVSTYYRISNTERIKLFKKIEPYLTFLDQSGLERKGADLQNRLETMEHENKNLRENINKIMEMIQQNPELANVKPETLTNKVK